MSEEILEVRTTYTLEGFLKNKENVKIGDRVKLPSFTVPEVTIGGDKSMRFDEVTVDDYATVYNIKKGKLYLVFDHALFQSAIDLNNTKEWKKTQLRFYLKGNFIDFMQQVGIPAKKIGLLKKDEMYGENALTFFKDCKNRIACTTDEKSSVLYWLETECIDKENESHANFCCCSFSGLTDCDYAYAHRVFLHVRPRFVIA